jgi:hypothetical protein
MTAKEKLDLVIRMQRETNHHEHFKAAQKGDKAAIARLNQVVDAINEGDTERALNLCK